MVSRSDAEAQSVAQRFEVDLRGPLDSVDTFLLLPGAHTVGHTLMEVGRPDGSDNSAEPHWLPYLVAHAGEGEG
jgi:hypothetical protein